MRATALRRITIALAALMVSACAGLRPDSDPMTFAGPPSPAQPGLHEGVSFSANFDAALRQAQDLRKQGEFDAASRVLGQLVIAAPNDARVIGEYGKVMLENGRVDDAVAFLDRAVTLDETDWTLFSALGVAYDQRGNHDAARIAFNHALALKPGEPAVLSNLALSHIQSGELDDAERLLLQASEQEKDVPGLADKLAMVRSLKSSALPSIPRATEPVADPQIQTPPPDVAPAPEPVMVEPPEDPGEDVPAISDDPEIEAVALAIQSPAAAPVPPPKIASVARAPVRARPPVQPKAAAEPRRTEPVAPPQSRPTEPPRPAGVARAVTRTTTIPFLAASPPEPWELMIRVSLPPPSAAVEKPRVAAVTPAAPAPATEPSGWGHVLERWSSAVLGFINQLWLRAYPRTDAGTA